MLCGNPWPTGLLDQHVYKCPNAPANRGLGLNRIVGSIIERPVFAAVSSMEPHATRNPAPRLEHHPLFQRKDPARPGKLEADIRSVHAGVPVLIDVMFSTQLPSVTNFSKCMKPRAPPEKIESLKLYQYTGIGSFLPIASSPLRWTQQGVSGQPCTLI